jgi:hypothetical protein
MRLLFVDRSAFLDQSYSQTVECVKARLRRACIPPYAGGLRSALAPPAVNIDPYGEVHDDDAKR